VNSEVSIYPAAIWS